LFASCIVKHCKSKLQETLSCVSIGGAVGMSMLVTFGRVIRLEGRLSGARYAAISDVGQSCYAGNDPRPLGHASLSLAAAASGVRSLCGEPNISKPTMNFRIVAERKSGG
jgi:hypothetical protein